jgi:hypothetical protein
MDPAKLLAFLQLKRKSPYMNEDMQGEFRFNLGHSAVESADNAPKWLA